MTLTATDTEPVRSVKIFGYAIKMLCWDKIVPVLIRDEALDAMASPPDHSLERLNEYRSQFEEIATRKHRTGEVESDGSVRVNAADV
jgi:hypothetical protein